MPRFVPGGYVMNGQAASHNPVDNTIVYIGPFVAAAGTTEGFRIGTFPRAGIIRRIDFNLIVTVVASGGEDTTLSLRINAATPTGGQLTTTLEHNANGIQNAFTGLAIPVAIGDEYEFELDYPLNFTTQPTGVLYSWSISVETPG